MAVIRNLQASFTGGELAPSLHSRVDLAKYRTGAKTLENWRIHPHGGISRRDGLEFIGTSAGDDRPRLIPFEASSNDTYVLEFGTGYMRVYREGVLVHYIGGPNDGLPFELALPYALADLRALVVEQVNDVLTITHENYEAREIARYGHDDWRVTVLDFQSTATAPTGLGIAATTNYMLAGQTNPQSNYAPVTCSYVITSVNTVGDESPPSAVVSIANDLRWYPANFNSISWASVPGTLFYNIYKDDNGLFGLIGTTESTAFEDKNYKANLQDAPPTRYNPFEGIGNYPRAVAHHQQRRFMGGTYRRPQTLFGSVPASFNNFSFSRPLKDSDAAEFTIAAKSLQKIRHIIAMSDMVVFTESGEWRVKGGDGDIITPTSISVKPQSHYGIGDVPPLVVGEQVLFVRRDGKQVRDLGYKFETDSYNGSDLSILSQHLLDGRTVVEWGYAQFPDSIIWCVMSDGALLSLTYMREHEVWGWSRHSTGGKFESVAVVRERNVDVPYFVVRRWVNGAWRRYIERMRPDREPGRVNAFFVDSGLSYDAPIVFVPSNFEAGTFQATGHGLQDGDLVDIETRQFGALGEGLAGTFKVAGPTSDFIFLTFEDGSPVDISTWTASGVELLVRKKVLAISGLDHLEGRKVVGLADGAVVGDQGELTVTGGAVTLAYRAARVHLGLAYESRFESLSFALNDRVAEGIVKAVGEVTIGVKDTSGLEVGPDFNEMNEHKARSFEDYGEAPALYSEPISIVTASDYNRLGTVCVRQAYPLPATILSIAPEIDYGG